jgi:ribosomal protein L22
MMISFFSPKKMFQGSTHRLSSAIALTIKGVGRGDGGGLSYRGVGEIFWTTKFSTTLKRSRTFSSTTTTSSSPLSTSSSPSPSSSSTTSPTYSISEVDTVSSSSSSSVIGQRGKRGFLSFPGGLSPQLRRVNASLRSVKGHTKKLNPVARLVTGMGVNEALAQLAFSASSRALAVSKVLERAIKKADIDHGLKRGDLVVEAAWTGKHVSYPRLRHHAKGRGGKSFKRTSQVSVSLREMIDEEKKKMIKKNNKVMMVTTATTGDGVNGEGGGGGGIDVKKQEVNIRGY